MSGTAASSAGNNVIDLVSPDEQAWKRQRRDGPRHVQRNGSQGSKKVIDLTHVPDRTEPGAANRAERSPARARHARPYNAEVPAQRRELGAHQRQLVGPVGEEVAALLHHPLAAAFQGIANDIVPPVAFPPRLQRPASPAQPLPVHPPRMRSRQHVPQATAAEAAAASPAEEENVPTCAICLDALKSNLCCAPCGHVFHFKCLKEAINKFKYCPTCRKAIKKESQIKKIFL